MTPGPSRKKSTVTGWRTPSPKTEPAAEDTTEDSIKQISQDFPSQVALVNYSVSSPEDQEECSKQEELEEEAMDDFTDSWAEGEESVNFDLGIGTDW